MAEIEGVVDAGAMSRASDQTSQAGTGLNERVNSLLIDLEEDSNSIQGAALNSFREGQSLLIDSLQGLIRWCNDNSVNLNLGHQMMLTTDELSEGEYAQVASATDSGSTLRTNPNA